MVKQTQGLCSSEEGCERYMSKALSSMPSSTERGKGKNHSKSEQEVCVGGAVSKVEATKEQLKRAGRRLAWLRPARGLRYTGPEQAGWMPVTLS